MGNFFYTLGRRTGKSLKKGKWIYKSHFGSAEEAIKAEYAIGYDLANKMKKELSISQDQSHRKLVNNIGNKLITRVKKKQRRFEFNVIISEDVNAFALPGGFIFCTQGILNLCNLKDDEIAFILSHEMVHVVLGHPLKRIMTNASLNVLSNVIKTSGVIGNLAKQTITNLIQSNYSRENELEADNYAVQLMSSAGFNPAASTNLLDRLLNNASVQSAYYNYFSSHPPLNERLINIKSHLKNK